MKQFFIEMWCSLVHNHRPMKIITYFKVPYTHAKCERCGCDIIVSSLDSRTLIYDAIEKNDRS